MLATADLRAIATTRLDDARALMVAGRYDWAFYTCGYAMECALKARVADALNWAGFPATAKEFDRFKSFKTHNLDTLLLLTGVEQRITTNHSTDWTVVTQWNPEQRYLSVGTVTPQAAQGMLDSTARLMAAL